MMHFARFRGTMALSASACGLALVLAACGSSSKTSTAASPGSAAAPSSTAASTSASSSTSSTSSGSAGSAVSTATSAKGNILVDAHGKSLYVFDRDTSGKIACLTGCTSLWPPLTVPSGSSAPTGVAGVTATLGTVMRPDGTTQITSNGRPLYTYKGDSAAGQTNGNGFAGIWHVAMTAGNGSAPGAASTGSTTSSSSGPYGY